MNNPSPAQASLKLESVRAQYQLEEKMKGDGMGYELAVLYRSQGRYTEATQQMKSLILCERELGYRVTLVDTYLENKQLEQALLNIDEILRLERKDNHFYFLILLLKIECLMGLSRVDEALLCIGRAEFIHQEDELMAWKGIAYMKENRIQMAKECFDAALNCNQENEKAWLGVGSVHCLKGDYELGLACYKKAQDIDSDSLVAKQLMAKFEQYGSQNEYTVL